MSKLSDLELTRYLESLDLNNPANIDKYNLFSQLLVISKDAFLELVELLIDQKTVVEDLLSLSDVNESTIRSFIETVKNNGVETTKLREEARSLLKSSSNYDSLFTSFVRADNLSANNDFQHYVLLSNQLNNSISSFAYVDEFSPDSSSFRSYESMNAKFCKIMSEDVLCSMSRDELISSEYFSKLPKLSSLVLNCSKKAEWLVETNKTSPLFPTKPVLIRLLKKLVLFGNYGNWDKYLRSVVAEGALESSKSGISVQDSLWKVVSSKDNNFSIFDLDKNAEDFIDSFLIYQLVYFYFPSLSVFDSLRAENLDVIKNEINSVRYYLTLCEKFLITIVEQCNKNLKP